MSLPAARAVVPDRTAIAAALAGPLALTAALAPFRASFPNTDAALALVLVIVAVAAAGRRVAGLLADAETTVLILAVGVAVTEIAVRGRRQRDAAARRAWYLDGITAAARAAAVGAEPQQLISEACAGLTRLLGLSACRFQDSAAGIGSPPRLLRDGRVVTSAGQTWDTELAGLPPGQDTELLAEAGGLLQGRFLLTPARASPC